MDTSTPFPFAEGVPPGCACLPLLSPIAAPAAGAPAQEPDPIVAAQADIERLTKERDKLAEDLQPVTDEHTQLHLALDAERAKPSQEAMAQQIVVLRSQNEQLTKERDLLKEQVPAVGIAVHFATLDSIQSAPVDISEASLAQIKGAFLEALAEHAVPIEEDDAAEAAPASPFISRPAPVTQDPASA